MNFLVSVIGILCLGKAVGLKRYTATAPVPIVALKNLGVPVADSCDGDFCVIPDHHEQAVMNRRLDDDAV